MSFDLTYAVFHRILDLIRGWISIRAPFLKLPSSKNYRNYRQFATFKKHKMKRTLHMIALAACTMIGLSSCMKDGEITIYHGPYHTASALDMKADSLKNFLVGSHFLPVEFYADKPIDYIEINSTVLAETDLNKYIISYIKDDVIPFNEDHSLPVMQNALKMPGADSAVLNRSWSISTSKEKNELYVHYLDN